MNKLSLFLVRHSQKLALASVGLALTTSYLIQPHYEMFIRYAVVATDKELKEIRPSQRLQKLLDEVCENFTLDAKQRARLDLFLHAASPHPIALGSLDNTNLDQRGYAFIGLPKFAEYVHPSDIPTDSVYFYTKKFPHGPYSPLGKQLLELLVIPDDVVRFMLARELVRLGVPNKNGAHTLVSARSKSFLTTAGMLGGLYGAYQTAYLLNRKFSLPLRWSLPHRVLLYTSLAISGLFCQWPLALAVRRHLCFSVDQLAASAADSTLFLHAGRQYYDWRIRWNRFWHERAVEFHARKNSNLSRSNSADPVRAYQDEQKRLKQEQLAPNAESQKDEGYHIPHFSDQPGAHTSPTVPAPSVYTPSLFQYRIDPRNRSCGNEQWAADGDGIGFGLTEFLNHGFMLTMVARFFALFVAPATSSLRLAQLDHLAEEEEEDGHVR